MKPVAVVLLIALVMPLCTVAARTAHLSTAEEAGPPDPDDELIILVTSSSAADRAAIRERIDRMVLPFDCDSWVRDGPFVAALLPLGPTPILVIGDRLSPSPDIGVQGGMRKLSDVSDLNLTEPDGLLSRRTASFRMTFPKSELSLHRKCFDSLKGLTLAAGPQSPPASPGHNRWVLTITAVSYGAIVGAYDPWTLEATTDQVQALVVATESIGAMALRKSVQHLWALPSSLALMFAWTWGPRIVRRLRSRRSTSSPESRDGEAAQDADSPGQSEHVGDGPEATEPSAWNVPGTPTRQAPPAGLKRTETVDATQHESPTKAIPLIRAAMQSYDNDWVPLSVIGTHVRAANPDFDPRTYGFVRLMDLMEKTGQFDVRRNAGSVQGRMKPHQ